MRSSSIRLVDKKVLQSYEDNSSENIEYVLKFQRSVLNSLITKGKVESTLKLLSQETENLTSIDENGKLKIFDKVEDIVKHFVKVRLTWYFKRKAFLINKLEEELKVLSNKARFINDIITKKLKINNVPKRQIILYLETADYDEVNGSYNYLLSMPIYSLTKERYEELLAEEYQKKIELVKIEAMEPRDIYITDLTIYRRLCKTKPSNLSIKIKGYDN